ncbi:MAG: hypothetical protein ABI557_03080 [Aureliella sp.]
MPKLSQSNLTNQVGATLGVREFIPALAIPTVGTKLSQHGAGLADCKLVPALRGQTLRRGRSNAYIYNASGDVRCEVEIPDSLRGGIGFQNAYCFI